MLGSEVEMESRFSIVDGNSEGRVLAARIWCGAAGEFSGSLGAFEKFEE